MENSDTYLGFYTLNETQDGDGYLGAILITDDRGRPLEFRVTHPVKPSAFQRPLYGDALEPYIGVELCGERLLTGLDHEIDLLIVSQRYLLDIREAVSCPVMYLERAGDAIEVESNAGDSRAWATGRVTSASGRFQPVAVTVLGEWEQDLERGRAMLEEAFGRMDLLEPFERMSRALELLAKEDQRFA